MGMRDYAIDDYGMHLTGEVLKAIASKVYGDYDEASFECDYYDIVNQLYENGIIEYISDFTGEAYDLDNNGNTKWEASEYYDCDTICYIPLRKHSTLFNAAYNNMNEIVRELREQLQEYLPDDFFYEAYLAHIVGTYFG